MDSQIINIPEVPDELLFLTKKLIRVNNEVFIPLRETSKVVLDLSEQLAHYKLLAKNSLEASE